MFQLIACIVVVVVTALVLPWFVSSMRKSHHSSGGGGLGPALMELDRILNPATTHVIQAHEKETRSERSDDEPLEPPRQ